MVWQETVNLPTYVTIGSIPITSTKFTLYRICDIINFYSPVAQRQQQLTVNQLVGSSILPRGAKFQSRFSKNKSIQLVIENAKTTLLFNCLGGGMVYTLVLEASAARIESSSLSLGTKFCKCQQEKDTALWILRRSWRSKERCGLVSRLSNVWVSSVKYPK